MIEIIVSLNIVVEANMEIIVIVKKSYWSVKNLNGRKLTFRQISH